MAAARLSGLWKIYAAAIALAIFALFAGQQSSSTPAEHALLAARYTARVSFLWFTLVYLAGPGLKLWPNPASRWLAGRRRHLGIAFGFLMTVHLVALLINITQFDPRTFVSVIPGMIAYIFIGLMVLTSTDAAQRRMGAWWRRMHTAGMHWIWFIFLASYAGRIFDMEKMTIGLLFTPIALALLGLRLWSRRKPASAGTTA